MHEEPGRVFFDRARRVVHCEADRDAALAYALGFVCHFALDSTCHPYVEQFTRESGVTHCEIETEFDNMLLRRDGYDPLKFFTASHIHPSEQNAKAIAPFYEGISEQVALDSLKGMISVHRLLQASNPVKRWVVLTGMKVVGKYDMLHGLVADPQPNPKCVESGKRLEELYAQALPLAETLILEFVAKLDTDQPLSKAFDHTSGSFERAQKMRVHRPAVQGESKNAKRKIQGDPAGAVMDPVRCGQLGLCADDRHTGAHFL